MSYTPPGTPLPAKTIQGNATNAESIVQNIPIDGSLQFTGSTLGRVPIPGRVVTANTTLELSDNGTSILVNSNIVSTIFLPLGMPPGMRVRVYQGLAGQVQFVANSGATLINTSLTFTQGPITSFYYADIENLGNDQWIVTGNQSSQQTAWNIYGNTSINEGDTTSYCIIYPSAITTNSQSATIQLTNTNFNTAGLDRTFAQGIADACTLDPNLSFNSGTGVLTVSPGANNPICFNWFVLPQYTNLGNRTISLTLSSPSVGTIPAGVGTVSTTINNVSKPTSPSLLFPTSTVTTSTLANSGQNQIVLSSASGLQVLSTVTFSGIPAQTWITAINGNTITLSNNLTSNISASSSLTITPPGFWFDFSTSSHITKNGSNQVSVATDLINGYTVTQSTSANQPVWNATALNSLGGLTLNGGEWLSVNVAGQVTKTTTASSAASSNTITLNNVTGLSTGMLVNDLGGIIYANTTISSIVGNVVHLSQNITANTLNSGVTIVFTPVGANHPLINLFDAAAQPFTVLMVAQINGTTTGFYCGWDSLNLQSSSASGHAFVGNSAAQENITVTSAVGSPYTWEYKSDGTTQMAYVNGQNPITTATVTSLATKGTYQITVDDTSGWGTGGYINLQYPLPTGSSSVDVQIGIPAIYFQRLDTILSTTSLYITHNPAFPGYSSTFPYINQDIPAGTILEAQSRAIGYTPTGPRSPACISQQFTLGSLVGTGYSAYCNGINVGNPVTPGGCVVGGTSAFPLNGVIYEMVVLPRMLTVQEHRGVTLYFANKWGVGTTTTTAALASAGATKIQLSSTTGIYYGQTINTTTGITAGTTVVGVNTSTNVIKLDTPVAAAGLTNGQSLTFMGPSFKQPPLLDITQFYPTFRDDFTSLKLSTNPNTVQQFPTTGTGNWLPYYGNPSNPGFLSAHYSALGHGSSDGATFSGNTQTASVEAEWYLDILNYIPWLIYNPFQVTRDAGAPSSELIITASPAPSNILNQLGYNAPTNNFYTYTSGYLRCIPNQMYGYYEARIKSPNVNGMWPAYWLTTADRIWPPEVDFFEGNGSSPGTIACTLHSNRTYTGAPTFTDMPFGSIYMEGDTSANYMLFGAEVGSIYTSFYLNRELLFTSPTPVDFHNWWYHQLDLAVHSGQGDGITSAPMNIDYAGSWKRQPQTPTIPTSTQPETTALLAAMTIQPSVGTITLINTLIASLKSYTTSFGQTLWQSLDFLYVLAAEQEQHCLINWKNPSQIGTIVGSPAFTADRGIKGSYGVSYIDTGINLSTSGFQLTSSQNHIGAVMYNGTNQTIAQSSHIGTAVSGAEDNSTYNLRVSGGYWIYNRNLSGTGNNQYNIPGFGANLFQPLVNYAVVNRNEYSLQYYVYPFEYNTYYPSYGYSNGITNSTTNALDNANLVIGNCSIGTTSLVHGGVYLTQDDMKYLYQLIYNYLVGMGLY